MQIAIFGRSIEEQSKPKLFQILDYFESRGVSLVWFEPFYRFLKGQLRCSIADAATYSLQTGVPDGCGLLLNLGGDGTFLESLLFVKDRPIPVTGIQFGRLGFLTGVGLEPDFSCLERLITGDYSVEERSVVEVSSPLLPESFFPYALNECAIKRKGPGMMSIGVRLQAGALPTYWADGLIVATPTGSTAYSLSVGGPIVFPSANVLIVAPIAPHNLNMRPIVIPDSEELSVYAQGRAENVVLTLDNRSISIPCGSEINIRKAPFTLHYISLQRQHFISALHEKLLWGFDKRNFGT
ncbi:MAG: NAD(+)/NADH kinase [Bacteroidales bacterium]|nr:NAD(+)/NADH kinase [Bacteroidales bacterium]